MKCLFCGDSVNGCTAGNHPVSGGSIPTSPLHFSRCRIHEVKDFVLKHHYLHTLAIAPCHTFRLDWNGALGGVAVFGYGTNRTPLIAGESVHKFRELVRFVLLDDVPKNSETKFLGWCLRWLKKNTELLAISAYADQRQGHVGTIYKAGNWQYAGEVRKYDKKFTVDGQEVHYRSMVRRFGTSDIDELKAKGHVVKVQQPVPKHKFIYYLHKPTQLLAREVSPIPPA